MRRLLLTFFILIGLTASAQAGDWWIPAAAHAAGAEDSVWRTDLTIRNLGSSAQDVSVTLLLRGTDNSVFAVGEIVTVPAGGTLEVADAVFELFSFDGAAALRFEAETDDLIITSRTYNLGETGSFGQSIPAVASSAAVSAGERVFLLGLSGTDGRRTNLGWVSLSESTSQITVELMDGSGSVIATRAFDEAPFGHSQLNDVFAALDVESQEVAYARVSADVLFIPYASVVASGSNDPVYVAARSGLELGTDLLIPAAVNAEGLNDTAWRTDVWILNAGVGVAAVELALWRQGQENPSPATVTLELLPGAQAALKDVVFELFGEAGVQGALVIHADQLVLAVSRTYNTAAEGTFGQLIPAQPFATLGVVGETTYLTGVTQGEFFRSNIGLVTTNAGSTLSLTLRDSAGEVVASASQTLGANEQIQKSLQSLFAVDTAVAATVEVQLTGADGERAVAASYLSMVDNQTGDPTYTTAARGVGGAVQASDVSTTILAVTGSLSSAVDQAGPSATAPKTEDGCITVDYSGDTIGPGDSPEGSCWQSSIIYDACMLEIPSLGLTFTRDGFAMADACVIDDYPSSLNMDMTTTLTNDITGEFFFVRQESDLELAFTFDGWRPSSAHVVGRVAIQSGDAEADAWGDLSWVEALVGLSPFPSGILKVNVPTQIDGVEVTIEVTATFDGTEWAYVQVRVGLWQTAFYVNLATGEAMLP